MKVFFDTEFTGLHQKTSLISIGCVTEDDRTFYAEVEDYDRKQINDWISKNVIPGLIMADKEHNYRELDERGRNIKVRGTSAYVAEMLKEWLSPFDPVEIWSDCLAYDWVLFCELFGGAFDIPKNIYYIPFDLSTLLHLKGMDPDVNREEFAGMSPDSRIYKHNALYDAQVIKACYDKLMTA